MDGFTPATAANSGPTTFLFNITPDVTAWLPERAKEKLLALRQHSTDLNRLIPDFDQLREAGNDKIAAEGVLRRLQAHPSQGGFGLAISDPRVVEAARRLEKLTAEHDRLKKLSDERSATWQAASQTLYAVEAWLKDGGRPGNTTLEDHETPQPTLLKGETVLDAIERLRRRGRELNADLNRVRSSCYPSSYCKQQMRQQVEALAQRGAVNVSRMVEHDGDLGWPTTMLRSQVTLNAEVPSIAFTEATDALALIAWAFKDQLIKRLDAEIAAEADDDAALSHAEREKRESVVLGDLLDVERQEAACVWEALAQNLPVFHRADCSPLAILQCRLITAPAVNPSPGSSPGMSWVR